MYSHLDLNICIRYNTKIMIICVATNTNTSLSNPNANGESQGKINYEKQTGTSVDQLIVPHLMQELQTLIQTKLSESGDSRYAYIIAIMICIK